MKTMLTTVPFSGFYETYHSGEINDAEEQMFADRETGEPNEGLSMSIWRTCDYRHVRHAYAKNYCENFGRWLKIDSLKFDELKSPRFYNFETDRIFAYISEADAIKLYNSVPYDKLEALAKERFTSRDGFASFYNPDIVTWGPVETWDHNQLGTVLELAADEETGGDGFGQYEELEHVDRERIADWIAEATPNIERLYRIFNYLETRAEREKEVV